MKLPKHIEAEALQAYHALWEANLSADMEIFASLMENEFSIFGTYTAQHRKAKIELRNRNISVQGIESNSLVIREQSELYVLNGDVWTFYGHARISCVLKQTDNGWKAMHQHVSLPDQTAELQSKNRELAIEAALERVRARTMAMQHSDELADASFVLDTQVRSLGVKTWGCAFNIYGDKESTEWFSSEAGAMPAYKTPREDIFLRFYNAGMAGEQLLVEEFAGEDCVAHYDYLCTVPVMGDALRAMKAAGGQFPVRQIDHATYFKYGYLLFITLEPAPDAYDIFIRFAKVFEQTYTRFLDLKKSEQAFKELQATQKQLIQSEKMASLGELTAGIAHEIQNPLNFVNNFSEINGELIHELVEEVDKGNTEGVKSIARDIRENSEKISHHGKRADGIVKGMLQHSRASSGQKEPADINSLVDEYLRLAYHGLRAKDKSFNAVLKTDFDESIPLVNMVPQDIGRVILNLLNNAFYAVNERMKTAENGFNPTVSISTKKSGDKVEITINDNGSGIPKSIVDKIFQPFFTTKPTGQGTGLGLSMSYDVIAKAHGGELKVDSKEGEGTEFVIVLPTETA